MSSRLFQGNNYSPVHSSQFRLIRRAIIKIIFIFSVSLSILGMASPVYARINQALTATVNTISRSSSLAAGQPAPLMFIANQGQYDSAFKFELTDSIGSVVFSENSILIAIQNSESTPPWVVEGGPSDGSTSTPDPSDISEDDATGPNFKIVEIHFDGVNPTPQINGENLLQTKVSYFLGNDPAAWETDVPTYSKIRYTEFAPGFDLEIDGSNGKWEWKLVAKGSSTVGNSSLENPDGTASRLAEAGEDMPDLSLDVVGGDVGLQGDNIVIETDAGNITLPLIEVPQGAQPEEPSISGDSVDSPYATEDGSDINLNTRDRDASGGEKGLEGFFSWIAANSYGSLVNANLLPDQQFEGEEKGALVFSSYFGGASDDIVADISYDPYNYMYITGRKGQIWTWPNTTPSTFGLRGSWDIYVARLTPERQLYYLAFIGGSYTDDCSGIAVDESGNAYIVGSTGSPNFPTNSVHTPYQPSHANSDSNDIILFKITPDGRTLDYSTYLGGRIHENGYGIVYVPGSGGKVYIVGDTSSSHGTHTFNAYSYIIPKDGLLAGFDTTQNGPNSLLTLDFYGGYNTEDEAHGIAISPLDGSIWIIGHSLEKISPNDFPVSNGFDLTPGGGFDAFVARILPSLNYSVSSISYFGGNGQDCELPGNTKECDIAVDSAGNAYITGTTTSSNLAQEYLEGGGLQSYGGGEDVFAAKIHSEACASGTGECLSLDYWRYLGGERGDNASTIIVSGDGDAYIAGKTESNNFQTDTFPKELSPYPTHNGIDAFLVRLSPKGDVSFFTYFGGTGSEGATSVALREDDNKAVIAGGINSANWGGFELKNPVDSIADTGWEGFVSEFTVPDWETRLTITSPTDWAMVLSLRPEFQWTPYPGTAYYKLKVYRVSGDPANPSSITPAGLIKEEIIQAPGGSSCSPAIPGDLCFKWKARKLFTQNNEGFELTSGEDLTHGGYAFIVTAYSAEDVEIAAGDTAFFQIPALGKTWDDYRTDQPRKCQTDGCDEISNPYWHGYDDLFYHWGEEYDIPPSMLKAIMVAETASNGAMINKMVQGAEQWFPPHMAYGYEPGWDYIKHWFFEFYNDKQPINPQFDYFNKDLVNTMFYHRTAEFDYRFFHLDGTFGTFQQHHEDLGRGGYGNYTEHLSSDNTCYINGEVTSCPFPYNRVIPATNWGKEMNIFYYGSSYMSDSGNIYAPFGVSLKMITDCYTMNPNDCVVNRKWMPAQYRLSASHGLSMLTYWDQNDLMEKGIPPEQLYDPVWGSNAIATTLSLKRCNYKDNTRNLGMTTADWGPTPWSEWRNVIIDYNSGTQYYKAIIGWQESVKPRPIVGDAYEDNTDPEIIDVDILYPPDQYDCGNDPAPESIYNQLPGKTSRYLPLVNSTPHNVEFLFSPINYSSPQQFQEENEFFFGENSFWVENVYIDNPLSPGIGSGFVRIYTDQSKSELLWESPMFDSVYPHDSIISGTLGLAGTNVIYSTWKVGPHSYRFYPITYSIENGFQMISVENGSGNLEDSFFSDVGGIFPYPDGTVAVGQRTYEELDEAQFYVYGYDGLRYFLQRIISPSRGYGDTTPPNTNHQLEPEQNVNGWWNQPVYLHLDASDNQELLMIRVKIIEEGDKIFYTPKNNVIMPFSEGRWNILYQSYDWAGNTEPPHSLEIKIDQTAPAAKIKINGTSDIADYYGTASIDLEAEDPALVDGSEGSGVWKIEYQIDNSFEWLEYQEPFSFEESGTHIIRYRAIDNAGNISEEKETTIHIDREPPDTGFSVTGCPEHEKYFNCPVQIELDSVDFELPDGFPGSGVDKIEYRLNGTMEWLSYTNPIIVNTSGRYRIEFRSIDKVGNIDENEPLEVWIDLESPESTATIIGEPISDGIYAPGATVELSAQDPVFPNGEEGSGLVSIEISFDSGDNWQKYTDPIVLEQPGIHTIFFRASDLAGNMEETRQITVEIVSDIEPPIIEVSTDPLELWPPNNKSVPVRIFGTAFDVGSGIQSIHIEVVDEYDEYEPIVQDILPEELIDGNWERTIELMASRHGDDEDGRKYTIIVTATDTLGNAITEEIEVIVPHDQGN